MGKYNDEAVLIWLSTNNARFSLAGLLTRDLKLLFEAIENCNNLKCLLGLISTLNITLLNKFKGGLNLEKKIIDQYINIISSYSEKKLLLEINILFKDYENIKGRVTFHENYPHSKIKSIEEKKTLIDCIEKASNNTETETGL